MDCQWLYTKHPHFCHRTIHFGWKTFPRGDRCLWLSPGFSAVLAKINCWLPSGNSSWIQKKWWKLEVGQRWVVFSPCFCSKGSKIFGGKLVVLISQPFRSFIFCWLCWFPRFDNGLCSLPAPSVIQQSSRKALMERYRYVSDLSILHVTLGYNVLKCWRMVAENEIVNRLSFHIPLSQKNVTFLATVPTKEDDLHRSSLWKVASYFSRGPGDLAERYPCVYTETTITAEFTLTELFSNACSENPQHIDLQANTDQHINTPRPLGQTLLAEKIRVFQFIIVHVGDFKLTNPGVGHPNS